MSYYQPHKRYRFRWPIVYVPLLVFLTVIAIRWVADSIEPSFCWDDILDYFRVYRNRERIKMLVILGVVVTTIVIIVRILQPKKEKDDC